MNKARVEAFTDAVVAIIMTIMVLEFKTPESMEWKDILSQWPYLMAYCVSFLFIAVAWYNHHYMFSIARRISKRIYWSNNLWLLTMSFIPVATAWTGRNLMAHAPEYFYLIVFFLWSFAYWLLTRMMISEASSHGDKLGEQRLRAMSAYRIMNGWRLYVGTAVTAVCVWFFPPAGLGLTLVELIFMAIITPSDADMLCVGAE
ncbi:MAG: TMEM175 family protein [Bifidobacteriaceae bacterium]|jgi:uncharacterized membrane protein|nr:TMEM175 family protein [Bifidobacteriaceae bacterium]